MCGIAGYTHLNRAAEPGIGQRLTKTLFHRGPDQQGVWESGTVTLAAVRLKIIDLGTGDQPIVSPDGDTVIAFNGEIYNYRELRAELQALGHRFVTQCDTEVVLNAFRQWDTAAFERLRGMFGVALWQVSRRRLVLARDRLGIKPVYLYRNGPDVYFASELKALFEHAEVPRELDLTGLGHYLCLNYVPKPYTLARGIEKLPPGHYLDWTAGRTEIHPYWRLDSRTQRPSSLGEAKERLDQLMRDSVKEHLVSDVPLGIWASGGLDSSTILHYAAEGNPNRLKTFSVGFPGRSFDESPYFREIAQRYSTDHHEFELTPEKDIADVIQEIAWYSDEPSADAGAVPVWYLSKMCRAQVTVALSGEGADELFGGYLTYQADRVNRALRLIPAPLRSFALAAMQKLVPVSDDKISLEYKIKRMLEGSLLPPDEAHFFWNGTFSPSQRLRMAPGAPGEPLQALVDRLDLPSDVVNRYCAVDQHYYLADDILYKCDRMSMAHSLEVRPPFLDHRIVEFAASLPGSLKMRGSQTKFLLRELVRDKLPASILNRAKTGFDIPTHDWFRGPLRPLLMDTLTPRAIAAAGVFDNQAIQTLIGDHMERRINAGYHLWGLLTLFLWMKRWRIATS